MTGSLVDQVSSGPRQATRQAFLCRPQPETLLTGYYLGFKDGLNLEKYYSGLRAGLNMKQEW